MDDIITAAPNVYQHPRCCARYLGGCSTKISREHYISNGVLKYLDAGAGIKVTGLPWIPAGTFRELTPASLTAKILCEAHNSALSPLDTVALRLFEILDAIRQQQHEQTSNVAWVRSISGPDIEKWLLKVAVGMYAAGLVRGSEGEVPKWDAIEHWVDVLFGAKPFPAGCGFYVIRNWSTKMHMDQSVQVAPRVNDGVTTTGGAGELYGLNLWFNGIPFMCNMAEPVGNGQRIIHPHLVFRPAGIAFLDERIVRTIVFEWNDGYPHEELRVAYRKYGNSTEEG